MRKPVLFALFATIILLTGCAIPTRTVYVPVQAFPAVSQTIPLPQAPGGTTPPPAPIVVQQAPVYYYPAPMYYQYWGWGPRWSFSYRRW